MSEYDDAEGLADLSLTALIKPYVKMLQTMEIVKDEIHNRLEPGQTVRFGPIHTDDGDIGYFISCYEFEGLSGAYAYEEDWEPWEEDSDE